MNESRDEDDDLESVEPLTVTSDDAQMMATARRRYGAVGAMVAGGMLGLDRLLGRKPKEESPVVWEASGEPEDIDRGMTIDIDEDTSVVSQPHRARHRTIRRRRINESGTDF
ncbi:MAG: hypothetical protein ACO38D_03945 [Ilumatobacteraceae bacterium]